MLAEALRWYISDNWTFLYFVQLRDTQLSPRLSHYILLLLLLLQVKVMRISLPENSRLKSTKLCQR